MTKNIINLNILPYLFLLLISFFILATNPFKSETIAPMDLLVKYPGWQNTGIKIDYIHGERSDVLDARLPIWLSAKKDLWNGELPQWNHQRAGKPGLTFTNSLFSPAFFTFALIKNDPLAFYLSNLMNVLIGLFGMYLFLRLFLDRTASVFGAFIFMFSGFNSAWFFWAHVNTAIWTPWVFYAVYKYLTTQNKQFLPLVTLTMLMLNLGGFPMVAIMTYMALAIMFIIFLIKKTLPYKSKINITLYLGLFSFLSVLIALPFIYPLIELLSWMGGIGYRSSGSGFKWQALELFINPDLYGSPRVETTFYVGILPLIFLFLSLIFIFKKRHFLLIFGLSLFLYAMTIAFTLISPDIIHKIPTLNSSLLTRFGYLIGVSLAIISAYTLNEIIQKFKYSKWLGLFIIIIFTIQIIDQRSLFQRFNGPVPNKSFYPETKSIQYVQEHIKPFQYILADQGFLIAGTLGGYGLNDWYAHSFHTPQEREVLRTLVHKPFKTPTSAMFPFKHIHLDSPYLDYLNIKFILATSFSTYDHVELWNNDRGHSPVPALPTNTLVQKFSLTSDVEIDGMSILTATYGDAHASSDIKLILKKDGQQIHQSIAKEEDVQDNKWVNFTFENPVHLDSGHYEVSLVMQNLNNIKPVTFWANTKKISHKLLVNGKETNQSLKMVLIRQKDMSPHFKFTHLEENIYIIENIFVKGGAYFISSLEANQSIEHHNIKTTLLSNTKIELEYQDSTKGWIILPMRSYPGWEVVVNSKRVEPEKFLGMLPAIKVYGESKIIISYNPYYNTYTYFIAIIALLLLLLSMYIFRKKGTP